TLRTRLRQAAGSQRFYAIANTSIAFDQMWQAIEMMLLKRPPVYEHTLDEVLSSMYTMVSEILRDSDIKDIIQLRRGESRLEQCEAVLALKDPVKIAMFDGARNYMERVKPDLRSVACERA